MSGARLLLVVRTRSAIEDRVGYCIVGKQESDDGPSRLLRFVQTTSLA